MRINFLNPQCQEPFSAELCFGICDNQDGLKAYTSISETDDWIAKVVNKNANKITFTAIDHCIIALKAGTNDNESTCDGMLTFEKSLFLVELKKQNKGGWISEAVLQLENTIKLLKSNHNLSEIRYKKAYACNKKHPNFRTINHEVKKRFFQQTDGFRLDIQTEIVIK